MKHQGKVENWNDDKGYGFVEPNNGSNRIFVHISAFKSRSRRPVNGDVIIFKSTSEKNNRYKATNISFVHDVKNSKQTLRNKKGNRLGTIFTLTFFVVLLGSVFYEKLPLMIAALYCVMSLITFITYAIDKSAAQNGSWRIAENTLHLLSLIGGWPGAFFAQKMLRHKTNKKPFKVVYWFIVLLNLAGFYWLHTEQGTQIVNTVILRLLEG